MLASIHPLGERARRSRWWLTVTAYTVGSTAGGSALGGLAGGAGALVLGRLFGPLFGSAGAPTLSPLAVTLVCGAAAAGEIIPARHRIPSWHRQVNEDWLGRYRGWVYGVGFGFQLGLGVVTIVTTTSVYAVAALAFLSRSLLAGAAIGALFGLARALPLVAGGRVQRPEQLRRMHAWLHAAAAPARRVASSTLLVVAVAAAWSAR